MKTPQLTGELLEKVRAFVDSFEWVFDKDWDHSKMCLSDDMEERFIKSTGTFIAPGVEHEGDDWAIRAGLLNNYRRLRAALDSMNRS